MAIKDRFIRDKSSWNISNQGWSSQDMSSWGGQVKLGQVKS